MCVQLRRFHRRQKLHLANCGRLSTSAWKSIRLARSGHAHLSILDASDDEADAD